MRSTYMRKRTAANGVASVNESRMKEGSVNEGSVNGALAGAGARVVLSGRRGARRALQGFLLSAGLGVIAGACAETKGIEVGPPSEGVVPAEVTPTPCVSDNGVECGTGCCQAGYTCTQFGRCVQADGCTPETSCSSDSFCLDDGRCLPWDTFPDGDRYNRACRTSFELPSVVPEVQCQWPGDGAPSEFPESVQVIGTPMVVDFDFDDDPTTTEPSIVFISFEGQYSESNGVLRVIDGETCALQASIRAPESRLGFRSQVSPALGDVDGDGRPDIVVADSEQSGAAVRSGVAIYKWTGDGTSFEELARRASASTAQIQGFSLHDLTGDELPEILTQNTILQYDPAQRDIVNISDDIDSTRAAALEPPIVCDIEGNGTAELVTGSGIFYWDTEVEEVLPKTPEPGALPIFRASSAVDAQFVALADLGTYQTGLPGAPDSVEMVAVGFAGELWVMLMDGRTILRNDASSGAGGPPVIADFDGDGRMEFASPGRTALTLFDLDCVTGDDEGNSNNCANPDGSNRQGIVWQRPIRGAQSGAAVFDFDGDGRSEVVYADQCFMRVYDGISGDVLFSVPRSSTTQWEYPVVADVDGDGKSELVTTSNDNDTSLSCPTTDPDNQNATVEFVRTRGVTVWRDEDDRWAGSRPIWNQHGYFVTNVNDDGTIPSMFDVQSHWNSSRNPQRPNTFRQNVQGTTGQSLDLPDVTVAGNPQFECPQDGTAVLEASICNRGRRTLGVNEAALAIVETDDATNVLCSPSNDQPLASGRCATLSCRIPAPRTPVDVTIMGDPTGSVAECDENNNLSSIVNVSCNNIPIQ